MTVLEIGAGGGYYARPLSALADRLVALDIQAGMLRRLMRPPTSSRLVPVQGDASHLPLADNSVDMVLAITVLGEVPSAAGAIAEIGRVLRPGGLLSVSEHWPDPDFVSFAHVSEWCPAAGFALQARYGSRFNFTAVYCRSDNQ